MKTKKNPLQQLTVVYIITKLELGGAQKVCLSLLDGLEQQHHQAFLISGTEGPLVKEAQKKENVILLKNFIREVSLFAFLKEIKTFFSLIKELRKLKKKYPNLIVHTHSTKAGLIGRWAAFFAGVKRKIHTIHGYGFNEQQPKIVWLAIYLLELASSLITTHFVCVSQKDANTGKKLFPLFSKKHTLIHAAIEWKKFYQPAHVIKETFQPARKEKTIIFGTISCFKKQKNLFDLLAAFDQTYKNHPNCQLEMIGDGTLRPQIEEWIARHNLNHAITLHGWQSNIVPIAQKWHALVMTSLWEGLPCTIIEARLLRLPVISYKTGGIPEVIIHGENGFLYEQKDWKGIAQGMITLIKNHDTYKQLKNYPDNLEMFKNQNMVDKHVNLYKNLR